jgi:hypothetical protein
LLSFAQASLEGIHVTKVLHGKINGRTIELSEDLGLSPGEKAEVQVRTLPTTQNWGEGLKRCAGGVADDPEWDDIMEEIHRGRKLERRPLPEDE